jgi:bifunctional DNA-binding transcriptional regulator/antitoxin component of YhaV-PrlF toxin-antitoxin module
MDQVRVDPKKRVVLPDNVRRKSGIRTSSKLKVRAQAGSIMPTKSISPDEFLARMEGMLKEGSPVQVADPLRLKEIWAGTRCGC